MIRLSRTVHDVATDASGIKGIGGIYNKRVFSERVPARHRKKHINWKEIYAILHAFVLWHKEWAGGHIRLACDNTVIVNAINKHSVKGETIRPLQTILLIARSLISRSRHSGYHRKRTSWLMPLCGMTSRNLLTLDFRLKNCANALPLQRCRPCARSSSPS
jgi:hypothetical protein